MSAGYVYRGTQRDTPRRVTQSMTVAEKDAIAVHVRNILTGLDASLAASAERRFRAMDRSCCAACGALFAGGCCDVCKARAKARTDVAA